MKCSKCKKKMKIVKMKPILDGAIFIYKCDKCGEEKKVEKSESQLTREELDRVLIIDEQGEK